MSALSFPVSVQIRTMPIDRTKPALALKTNNLHVLGKNVASQKVQKASILMTKFMVEI